MDAHGRMWVEKIYVHLEPGAWSPPSGFAAAALSYADDPAYRVPLCGESINLYPPPQHLSNTDLTAFIICLCQLIPKAALMQW